MTRKTTAFTDGTSTRTNGTTRGSHAFQFARAGLLQARSLSGQVAAGPLVGRFCLLRLVPAAGRSVPASPSCSRRAVGSPRRATPGERASAELHAPTISSRRQGQCTEGRRRARQSPKRTELRHSRSMLSAIARFEREEAGLRPAVLRSARCPPAWARCCCEPIAAIPWFRENIKCLTLLVLIGVAIACVRGLCLWRAETVSTRRALDAATRLRRTLHRQTLRLGPGDLTDPEGTQVIGLFTQGGRPGSRRHSDLDLSLGLRSVAARRSCCCWRWPCIGAWPCNA